MTADCDTLVWGFFVPLELGIGVVVVVAAVVVGHFPLTDSEPSGHGVVVVGVVSPLLPSLLPLLLSSGLLRLLLLVDEVVSELCFFFAKTVLGYSDIKTIGAIEERRIKIVNTEIVLKFILIFVLIFLLLNSFFFFLNII